MENTTAPGQSFAQALQSASPTTPPAAPSVSPPPSPPITPVTTPTTPMSPPPPEVSLPQAAPPPPAPRQPKWLPILTGLLMFALGLGGVLTYHNYQLGQQPVPEVIVQIEEPVPVIIEEPTIPATSSATLLPGWTQKEGVCNITYAIPPVSPDQDERYWQYEPIAGNLWLFDETAESIIHRNATEASGYISGVVQVFCKSNSEGLTTAELLTQFESAVQEENEETSPDFTFQMSLANDVLLWGEYVKEIIIEGGMLDSTQAYYLLATDETLYLITHQSHSESPEIQSTTKHIFESLQFDNE